MYARYMAAPSSPESWDDAFESRSGWHERLALLRLKSGADPRWRAMSRHLPRPSSILDVGCGLGTWCAFLGERGHDAFGVDYSVRLLLRAQGQQPRPLALSGSSAEHLPFRSGSFDVLFAWGVIEHDPAGPGQALREFLRVLRPGGVLLVTVPLDSPKQREVEGAQPSGGVFYEYHFEPAEVTRSLEEAGFQYARAWPVTKSPHLAAPRLYRWVTRRHALVREIGVQMLKPATWGRPSCFHMVMGSGVAPPDTERPG